MKVNIYYGGRGLIEDATLYVISKLQTVLEELRVEVHRYNLYEEKNTIATLPATLKQADGIILASSLEWFGIGGYMQQFLDACWLYGDKEKISQIYMMPVVVATTYGEKEAELTLTKAWETLGGIPSAGLSAYVEEHVTFEMNQDFLNIIEKKAEMFYRTINQKQKVLPSSNNVLKASVLKPQSIELTPQESEQLSRFVSDDTYVKKQKEDIEELTAMFKQLLNDDAKPKEKSGFIDDLKQSFNPEKNFRASYMLYITDTNKKLIIEVDQEELNCYYGDKKDVDVIMKTSVESLQNIIQGKVNFQRAFMAGDITAKGNFKTLKMLDQIFKF